MFEELLATALRPLIEYRRELSQTMTAEEARDAVASRAKEMGLTVHALVPEKYREEVLGATVRDFAQVVADAMLAEHELLTVEEFLTGLAQIVAWDAFLVDFVEQCAGSNEPPSLPNAFAEGGVLTLRGLRFLPLPVVLAWSTPFSHPGTVAKKFKDEHLLQFGRLSRMGPGALKEATWYLRLMDEGKSNRQIADLALRREGFDLRAVDEAEYKRELRRRTDKVRQFRKRIARYVTEIDEFQSRDSG